MKKLYLLVSYLSVFSIVACNQKASPKQVDYSEFYQKIQEIEENHHSHATLTFTYFDELSGDGETRKATLNYIWSDEQNEFVPDGTDQFDLVSVINRTIKNMFRSPEENQDLKNFGCQYFIEPFKYCVDYTETVEERTIRTVESHTYNDYGYLTDYLLQATVNGTYKGESLNGTQKTAYSISYK